MKRSLDQLLGGSVTRSTDVVGRKHQRHQVVGPRTDETRVDYGLASGGLQRAFSGGTCSDGGAATEPPGGPPEMCSPLASKPLGFVAPMSAFPLSPFDKPSTPADQVTPCPVAPGGGGTDRRHQAADGGGASSDEDEDWENQQENQQPCGPGSGSGGAEAAAATWLFSPVSRGRPPASAPLSIPLPHSSAMAGLLSPGMPTPARNAPLPAGLPASLHHAPSFSSWMVSAGRPPSPQGQPQPGGGAGVGSMADVVAGVLTDVTAARRFDGRPSHLDYLLAKLGDTHYPSSVMQWEQEEIPDSPHGCT
ncbi:hypothetical protein ACK3TF_002953 [Chlorella vulgaris]